MFRLSTVCKTDVNLRPKRTAAMRISRERRSDGGHDKKNDFGSIAVCVRYVRHTEINMMFMRSKQNITYERIRGFKSETNCKTRLGR